MPPSRGAPDQARPQGLRRVAADPAVGARAAHRWAPARASASALAPVLPGEGAVAWRAARGDRRGARCDPAGDAGRAKRTAPYVARRRADRGRQGPLRRIDASATQRRQARCALMACRCSAQHTGPCQPSHRAGGDTIYTNVDVFLGWPDRLRVLFGRTIRLRVEVATEHLPGHCTSTTTVSVDPFFRRTLPVRPRVDVWVLPSVTADEGVPR